MLLLTILLPAATIISYDKKNIERFLYTPMEVHIESTPVFLQF